MPKNTRLAGPSDRRENADALAVAALSFIAADEERLSRFLALSGLDIGHLRAAAAQDGFLAGVLAYLVSDEALLLDFAAASGHKPERIVEAHVVLNGTLD